jgi:tRNA pseudouridine32 synthase / 23S rRNA pseudouridine746 synthase
LSKNNLKNIDELPELKILYEDNDIIAVDKPEGLASIAENDTGLDSLHSILEKKLAHKIFIVHRLDKEVSGVILFAKNSKSHKLLNNQFASRTVSKKYIALVHGSVKESTGVIKKPIREFGSGRMGIDERHGKQCSTNYKVLERLNNYTLLELNPTTGRRHQLRVHLYSIGHSIVGDIRYGEKIIQEEFLRVMLHAKSLEFVLPSMENIFLEAAIPESFIKEMGRIKQLT